MSAQKLTDVDLPVAEKSTRSRSSQAPRPSWTLRAVQAEPAVPTSAQEQLQDKVAVGDMELTMVAGEPRTVQRALEKKVLAVTTHFPLSVKLGTTGKAVPSQSELVILASMPWGGVLDLLVESVSC